MNKKKDDTIKSNSPTLETVIRFAAAAKKSNAKNGFAFVYGKKSL